MRSKIFQRILDKMEKDPWHVKLKRWCVINIWVYACLTRKYWDKSHKQYIFKTK